MKLQALAISMALALVAAPVAAQDKKDSMKAADKAPTAQECKDWMAKNKDAKKDDPMMKKCDDAMKKDAMAPKK